METIASLLKKSIAFLIEKNIGEARRTAELLLAHALNCNRIDLYLRFDTPLGDDELERYRELIRRRLHREPTQYIIGVTEFYGMEFEVAPAVLIPRPETEHLVEAALEILKSFRATAEPKALDIGTGSGIIPIALCSMHEGVRCTAIDVSAPALEIARRNAERREVSERIKFIQADILDSAAIEEAPFHLVVSNPPYISAIEYPTLQPEITRFEPEIALNDGTDGLTFYRRIANRAAELIIPGGTLIVETGYGQADDVRSIFSHAGLSVTGTVRDYSGIERVVLAERK